MPCRRRMRAGISKPLILRPLFLLLPLLLLQQACQSQELVFGRFYPLFVVCSSFRPGAIPIPLTTHSLIIVPLPSPPTPNTEKSPNTYQILLFYKSPVDFTRNLITSSCLLSTISPKYHDSAANDNRDFRPIHETINHLTITNQST